MIHYFITSTLVLLLLQNYGIDAWELQVHSLPHHELIIDAEQSLLKNCLKHIFHIYRGLLSYYYLGYFFKNSSAQQFMNNSILRLFTLTLTV